MLIRVMYNDGRLGMVRQQVLDRLLERKNICSFMRSDGWAVVGRDRIRRHHRLQTFSGEERRYDHTFDASWGKEARFGLFREVAWIASILVLISVLFTGVL